MMPENSVDEVFLAHYHETKDKVFTYLMYRLNFDRETSEDLLMDIVLKAYEKFYQFDSEKGSFKNWILRIAHNHLVNHWRDKKEEYSLDDMEEGGAPMPSVDLAEEASGELRSEAIHKTLLLLSDAERELITLRYLSDLDYEEIAVITGKGEGAIRTGLSRALKQFKHFHQRLYGE